jgi:predicted transcriptional regulator
VPIFSKFQVVESLDRLKSENDYIEVVTTKSIIDSIKDSNIGDEFFKFVRQGKIELYLSETVDNFYFVCADTFASLFLFDCDGDFDNLNMLLVTDPLKVRAANELFEIYKNNLKF